MLTSKPNPLAVAAMSESQMAHYSPWALIKSSALNRVPFGARTGHVLILGPGQTKVVHLICNWVPFRMQPVCGHPIVPWPLIPLLIMSVTHR